MSIVQKLEKVIFLTYKEGDSFTTSELQKLAVEKGIIDENNDTAVRNTLFSLRNDIRLRRIERGCYQIAYNNRECDESESTEKLFELLISRIKRYKAMNPVNDDKESMLKASEEVDKYRKYMKSLQNLLEYK